ncbi:hypothetical protein [Halocella sp. SP3-1]|uniref:hypothetical protein n=1 Tax=Halocella sp. SP3-1 TaxID=2382161 RepID=UPI000F74D0D8|nr:hypothetical protein [Halocella sp. SP3-1]AZO96159.1 hypothetical protein D7D81_17035 [Halocella sp. SP3-1]
MANPILAGKTYYYKDYSITVSLPEIADLWLVRDRKGEILKMDYGIGDSLNKRLHIAMKWIDNQ